jgi:hypothetical protein
MTGLFSANRLGGGWRPAPRPVWGGVSKGVEDSRRPPQKQPYGRFGVPRLQGVEGSSMGETLGSPWIPLAVRACHHLIHLQWHFLWHTVCA